MRKSVSVAGLAVCLAVASPTTQAFADDRLIQEIENRLARLPRLPPPRLSNDDFSTVMRRLASCWDVPPEVRDAPGLAVSVEVNLNRDGSLAAPPHVTNRSQNPLFDKVAASAIAAVRKCAPFASLPPAKYESWKKILVDFDPRAHLTP